MYLKAKLHLKGANLNLRKFETNSLQLREKIANNEQRSHEGGGAQSSGDVPEQDPAVRQVLGIDWDIKNDQLLFDVSEVACLMKEMDQTKRNVISLATRFYDPLDVISPVTVRFKQLFQKLCEKQVEWDEPLTRELVTEWESLTSDLQQFAPIMISRHYPRTLGGKSFSLTGFCDASQKAYAAVIYIRAARGDVIHTQFVCSKTRVAPVKKMTIPRLELLSALLLARLTSTVQRALEPELQLEDTRCYTDSTVALSWITGLDKEWKQFVINSRQDTEPCSTQLLETLCWNSESRRYSSRGVSSLELQGKIELWLNGRNLTIVDHNTESEEMATLPQECLTEMRGKRGKSTTVLTTQASPMVVLPCENYSCLKRLIRITVYILKFVNTTRARRDHAASSASQANCALTAGDLDMALTYWIKISQLCMLKTKNFDQWKSQFGLYLDDSGIWRCGGRLGNSDIPEQTKHPILLSKDHHLALLIVQESHKKVMHGGVKATLTEVRSRYWIVQGRNFVRRVLRKCTVCRRFQGGPYTSPPAPPLPSFRVNEARPFSYTGVDFAGPLYVRDSVSSTTARKVWLCLYTCCTDIVPDVTAKAFIQCFRRFTARRGFPTQMISDNAKTFKAASRVVASLVETKIVHAFLSDLGIK